MSRRPVFVLGRFLALVSSSTARAGEADLLEARLASPVPEAVVTGSRVAMATGLQLVAVGVAGGMLYAMEPSDFPTIPALALIALTAGLAPLAYASVLPGGAGAATTFALGVAGLGACALVAGVAAGAGAAWAVGRWMGADAGGGDGAAIVLYPGGVAGRF